MVISPITMVGSTSSVGAQSGASATASASGPTFGQMLGNALNEASNLSTQADSMAASYAAGGPVSVDQLMMTEQQASLAVDLVVQVRDRVVSAYQTIMNMQV